MKHIAELRQQKTWLMLSGLLSRLLGGEAAVEIITNSRALAQDFLNKCPERSEIVREELECVIVPRVCVIKELKRIGIDAGTFVGVYFSEIMGPVISGRLERVETLPSRLFAKLSGSAGALGSAHAHEPDGEKKALWDKVCRSLGCPEACSFFKAAVEKHEGESCAARSLAYLSDSARHFGGTHFFGGHGTFE